MPKKQKKKKRKLKVSEQKETEKIALEILQTSTDVNSFLEKFRADVEKKRKAYQLFVQKSQKKK